MPPIISSKKFFQNFGSLLTGKIIGDFFSFLFFITIAREFGERGIGQYSFAMALTAFIVIFADFGFFNLSIKEMGRHQDSAFEYFNKILFIRVVLSVSILITFFSILSFLSSTKETITVLAIIGIYQIFNSFVDGLSTIFIAREDMHLAGTIEASLRMITSLIGIIFIKIKFNLYITLCVLPVISFLYIIFTCYLITWKYEKPRLVLSFSHFYPILRDAVPYGLSAILRRLATRIDVVFLGIFLGANAVGIYNVGFRVVFLLFIIPRFVGTTLLPVLSRLFQGSIKDLHAAYHQSLNFTCLISLPVAAGLWLIAPEIIELFFGEDFIDSVIVLRCLAWLFLLAFFHSVAGTFLIACDQQMNYTKNQWIAACANVLGNIVLIPIYGVIGAAISTLLSEALLVLLIIIRLKEMFGWPLIWSRIGIGSLAAAAFVVFIVSYEINSLLIVIPVSILLYCSIVSMFKAIRENEFQILKQIFRENIHKQKAAPS
jgi:O-antigen/teichoic acid export membrane protein